MVNKITTQELRQGKINGGIIFQGCAEPHDDWVNGVNDMLTEEGILLEGTKYKPEDCYPSSAPLSKTTMMLCGYRSYIVTKASSTPIRSSSAI